MPKKPKPDEVPMVPLNVDIPADLLRMLKIAKGATDKPLRTIAVEAFTAWLKNEGITQSAASKLPKPK